MSTDELKIWFFDKLNSCYPVIHDDYPETIFWFYDDSFVRKMKLSNITKKDLVYPKKISGKCLFYQVIEHKTLWCEYANIWLFLYDEYINNYKDVQILINSWLLDFTKMKSYDAHCSDFTFYDTDYEKMKIKL